MSGLLDELDEHHDREITLGTSALLGIFFGVVLVCAVFFGLGYSLGRRSGDVKAAALPAAKTQFASSKSVPADSAANQADESATDKPSVTPPAARTIAHTVAKTTPPPAEAADVTSPVKAASSKQPATMTAGSASISAGQTMVQLMAAAQPEDAEVLAAALRKRGYHAIVRDEPDHLYHVQVGPFATRADADTMRRKLQADGYNAILK